MLCGPQLVCDVYSRKKETVGWNKVDNSYKIQRINMKF